MGSRILSRHGRVGIRKFKRADLAERLAWPPYTDPFFLELNYSLSTFLDRERWLLTRTTNAGRMYFAIEDEGGRLVGEMSLREIDGSARTSRLGIHLASDKVGRGYGSEAIAALLAHYFGKMGFNCMYLDVAAFNQRALRVYERLSFDHISDFWRTSLLDPAVLDREPYRPLRRFFRRGARGLECLHYDMVLTGERYHELAESGHYAETKTRPATEN